ncbi:hypothetical protein A9Q89_01895 [Gammaproteobacteria bacterium 53_120_T64]|nr:hypothetical protein A9Q89_01895 [Gammaproteobacteria bacterium 53_120_T64]
MATVASENAVQELYIAYFGRPADPAGVAFYAEALDAGTTTIEDIAASFGTSTEAAPIVALSTDDYLAAVYLQAFSRAYDTAVDGTFWADAINSGATTKESAMIQILNGAQANDALAVTNKVTVASTYTMGVITDGKSYTTPDIAAAQAVLTPVTSDAATVTSGNTAAQAAVDDLSVAVDGTTFALTTAADAITGTADADLITGVSSALASANTLDVTDTIDGGAGNDTFTADLVSNFTGFTTGSMTNVENISLTNTSSIPRTFDASGITGVTSYTINSAKGVSLSDLAATATVSVKNQASGNFSTAFATGAAELTGTTDAMTLSLSNVGTAASATGVTPVVTEAAVTITANDIETLAIQATGTNVINLAGTASDLTGVTIAGSGSVKVTDVEATLTSFDASSATGAITADVTSATALTTVATGSGDDALTFGTGNAAANATLSGGAGTDTLTLSSGAKTVQYTQTGFETLALNAITGALVFSGANVSDLTTVSSVATTAASVDLANMGASALTFKSMGATVAAGAITSDHAGATTIDYSALAASVTAKTADVAKAVYTASSSAGALTLNAGEYVDVHSDSVVTAAVATSLTVNVASGKSSATTPVELTEFGGQVTVAKAASITVNATGKLDSAIITAAAATGATITNGETAGSLTLAAAALENLTVTTGNTLSFAGSTLTGVQVANVTASKGTTTLSDMNAIASLTLAGTGTTAGSLSAVALGVLGNGTTNAYDMNVTASGLKGGLTIGTMDAAAGSDITLTVDGVTGLVTQTGALGVNVQDVTISAVGTGGAVSLAVGNDIVAAGNIAITGSSTGAFTTTALVATGTATVNLDGTVGAVNLAAITGSAVTLDVSDTIGGVAAYGTITATTAATVALSTLQANTIVINAAAASTALTAAVTGGIDIDNVTITGTGNNTSITVTGNLDLGTDVVVIDGSNATAAQAITFSGLTNYDGATVTGSGQIDTIVVGAGANSITGGVGADVITLGAGVDTLVRNGDGSTDGADTVSGFTVGTGGDIIDLTTNVAQMAATDPTTGFNTTTTITDTTAFIAHGTTVTQGAAATAAQATAGFTVGTFDVAGTTNDAIYIAWDNGTDTFIGELVSDAGDDGFTGDTLTLMLTLTGVADATTLTAANFADFT